MCARAGHKEKTSNKLSLVSELPVKKLDMLKFMFTRVGNVRKFSHVFIATAQKPV